MSRPAGESDEDESDENGFDCLPRFRRVVNVARPLDPLEKLFKAVDNNDVAAAQAAIDEGADLHSRIRDMTPIMKAAELAHYEVMEFLIHQGAKINDSSQCTSVIMWLCKSSSRNEEDLLRCFLLLVEHGANLLETDWVDCSCLILAAWHNHPILITPLIERGCDVNAVDGDGYAAINYAVEKENLPMVEFLIEKGARIDVIDKRGERLIDKPQVLRNNDLAALLGVAPEEEVVQIREPLISPFRRIMAEVPNRTDRLYGYHPDAVRIVRAMGLSDVAASLAAKNIQLGHVLTWSDQEWKESGVIFSFHLKKIALCVKKYHERPWGRKAIPEPSGVVAGNEVELFRVVLCLLDFLRLTHITSTTSLYLLKNLDPSNEDRQKVIADVKKALDQTSLANKQLHSIKSLLVALDDASIAPPDLVTVSHKRTPTVKLFAYRVFLSVVVELGVRLFSTYW